MKKREFKPIKFGVYWKGLKIDLTYEYDTNYLAVMHGKTTGFFSVPKDEITEKPVKK